MSLHGLSIALVGPLPPPEGGMANQTRQLAERLASEGAQVTLVRTNAPYRPGWLKHLRGVRALARLVPYLLALWRTAGQVDVLHVMANSGWSWHLCAAPAIWIARLRGVPTVVNYRGGEAERFLERSAGLVCPTLRAAKVLAVPSGFLQAVFGRWDLPSRIVPNIVDLERFRPAPALPSVSSPHLVVARSLEDIYDLPTALRALRLLLRAFPRARLTVAGEGPQRDALIALSHRLDIADAVHFCGRLDRQRMAELYRAASLLVNPAKVDNMPNSLLEAMASGVPVVSTSAGGVPYLVRDGVTALLVPAGDHAAMAAAAQRVLSDPQLAAALRQAGLDEVQKYTWAKLRDEWTAVYASLLAPEAREARAA